MDINPAPRTKAIRIIRNGAIASLIGLVGTWAYPIEWMVPPGLGLIPFLFINLAMYVGPVVLLVGLIKLACAKTS